MADTEACCSRPAIVKGNYTPNGDYENIAGLKTYITGPKDSSRCIVVVYDVFGLATQTIQGADRLSSLTNSLVLIPDFFKGEPLDADAIPPDTDEKKAKVEKFRKEKTDANKCAEAAVAVRKEAASKFSTITSWGAFGLCFGGKVTALLSGPDTHFKAAGTAHPGRLEPDEAARMTIPYICLYSKDDVKQEYTDALKKNGQDNVIETYETMHHGWMGARANFDDAENFKEYERGYDQVAEFFKKHL